MTIATKISWWWFT